MLFQIMEEEVQKQTEQMFMHLRVQEVQLEDVPDPDQAISFIQEEMDALLLDPGIQTEPAAEVVQVMEVQDKMEQVVQHIQMEGQEE